ncbi:hypothetical protein ACJX0J_009787, partial [Zea mays]
CLDHQPKFTKCPHVPKEDMNQIGGNLNQIEVLGLIFNHIGEVFNIQTVYKLPNTSTLEAYQHIIASGIIWVLGSFWTS